MFQSVLDQRGLRSGRFGTGAGVSVLVHAGIFAAALLLSAGAAQKVQPPERELVFVPPPRPPKGNPNPPSAKPPPPPKPRQPRPRRQFVQPAVIPPPQPEVEPSTPEPENPVDPSLPHVAGGHIDGDPDHGDPTAPPPIFTPELPIHQFGEEAIPFQSGMSMPRLLSGEEIQYTREALRAGVRGTLVAKCVITREGDVENCRILKGLPYMEQAVLSALESRRYRPVQFQGEPVSVSYIFNVRLEMPH